MENQVNRGKLMIASFLTLVAAGMGFAARGAAGPAWAEMGIGPGDFGGIMGAGFLGFGFVILGGGVLVELFGSFHWKDCTTRSTFLLTEIFQKLGFDNTRKMQSNEAQV